MAVHAGERVLLDGVDLEIRSGERVLITGPNGAGKSSLLRAIEERMPEAEVGVLPQTHDHLRIDTSVIDYFRSKVPVYPEDAEQILTGYLFGEDQWQAPLRTLSAGEVRRLLLAVLVNRGVRVLLLDEPTNYLDFDSLDVIERALVCLRRHGCDGQPRPLLRRRGRLQDPLAPGTGRSANGVVLPNWLAPQCPSARCSPSRSVAAASPAR